MKEIWATVWYWYAITVLTLVLITAVWILGGIAFYLGQGIYQELVGLL